MKTIITAILVSSILFFIGCKEEKKIPVKSATNTSENMPTENKTAKTLKNQILKQQGSYTELFKREPRDCGFISSEILAASLQVSNEIIKQGYNTCIYNLTEENDKKTRFYFTVEPWSNKRILKEINMAKDNAEAFGKDSKLSQYRISETGDTYLSMHQNRMVRLLNEKSNNVIIIFYNVEIDPSDTDYDKKNMLKDIAREQAYSIANFLLNTYKK
ncbi:MAG: hypothetical protein JKY22_08390 [Flavobacteriaceae bacterium]|nr:hypothetical protein [Flavobacteriaceae bacterium]